MYGLYQILLYEKTLLLLLQDIQKLLKQEWEGVRQSLGMSRNTV
jgi:hypothetical protein